MQSSFLRPLQTGAQNVKSALNSATLVTGFFSSPFHSVNNTQEHYKIIIAGLISLALHLAFLLHTRSPSPTEEKTASPLSVTLKAIAITKTEVDLPQAAVDFALNNEVEMPLAWQARSKIPATHAFSPKLLFPTFEEQIVSEQIQDSPARIVYEPELNLSIIEKAINVEVEILIDETGLVTSAEVIRSNLSEAENDLIRKEMARFMFYPAIKNNQAVISKKRFEFIREAQ